MRNICLSVLLIFCLTDCRQKLPLGRKVVSERLERALAEAEDILKPGKFLVNEKDDAIALAEVYLFSVYSKANVKDQRSYEVYLIDHYWVMNGTSPLGKDGGNFEIVLDAETSEVERLVQTR